MAAAKMPRKSPGVTISDGDEGRKFEKDTDSDESSSSSLTDSDEENVSPNCNEGSPVKADGAEGGRIVQNDYDKYSLKPYISEEMIQTTHNTIIITPAQQSEHMPNPGISYKLWCKDTRGTILGMFEQVDYQYIKEKLAPNKEYIIEVQETEFGKSRKTSTLKATTLFCSPPRRVSMKINQNKFSFSWQKPMVIEKTRKITNYTLLVYNYITKDVVYELESNSKELKMSCHLDDNSYLFTLYANSENLTGGKADEEYVQLKHRLIPKCTLLQRGQKETKNKKREVYLLHVNEEKRRSDYVIEKDFGNLALDCGKTREIVMLLVGETGSGKTSWINAFVNFVFDVKRNDPFRFKIIEDGEENVQTESQTQWITIYRLRYQQGMAVNYDITLIDTPGFGDTRGIDRDKGIENEIHALFKQRNGYLNYINAIAFVTVASMSRLTPTQKYILDSILSLFGKNLEDSLILLSTHAHGHSVEALSALKKHKIKIKKSYHFENSQILNLKPNSNDPTSSDIWQQTMTNFKKMTQDLTKAPPKSVSQTTQVLQERERVKLNVSNLRRHIDDGIKLLEQFKTELEYLQDVQKDSPISDHHVIRSVQYEPVNDTENRQHNYCTRCKVTCHENCPMGDDGDLQQCVVMETGTKSCTICPNKCPWNQHVLQTFRLERMIIEKLVKKEDIEERYAPPGEELTMEELHKKLREDFEGVSARVKASISEIDHALRTLADIALLCWPKSQVEYIQQLIRTEHMEMQVGYLSRLELLREIEKEATYLGSIDGGKYDPFGQYRELLTRAIESGEDVTRSGVMAKVSKKFEKIRSFFSGNK